MASVSKSGFYLYRNCIYDIDLKNNIHLSGRLINIQKDTLYFSNFFNADVASNSNAALDTFPIHYHSLYKLNLIADRAMGIYTKYAFDNFDFIFKKDTARCYLQSYWDTIFSNDPAKYELVPRLTAQGIKDRKSTRLNSSHT